MMTACPRPCLVVVALLLACTSTSGPSPLMEPAGTILAVSNSAGTATFMVIGDPGDSTWRFVTDPDLYLGGYVAKLVGGGDEAITIVRDRETNQYSMARLDLNSGMLMILLDIPSGVSAEYVIPNPVSDDIMFTAYNWPGLLPGLSLLRFDPGPGTVTPELPDPLPNLFHLDRSPDGRRLVGLMTNDEGNTFIVMLDRSKVPVRLDTLQTIPSDLVFGPTVAPDNSGLIFSWTGPGGGSGVWSTERLDFADPEHTTSIPINGLFPVYSPDGRWLAYTDAATQEAWLYRFADGYRRKAFTDHAPRLLIRDWK